jgi:protein subunit release factor A
MAAKTKLFSVGIEDCRVDTFTVGGNGGSGKDTSNTGVRITHPPSGGVGKATDTRSQTENRRLAFIRMAGSKEFQAWTRRVAAELKSGKSIDETVEESMSPENLRIEARVDGKWTLL